MAKSNNELIGELMTVLKVSLKQYVVREYKSMYGGGKYLVEVEDRLGLTNRTATLEKRNEALETIDAQGWLKFLNKYLKNKLGTTTIYVSELIESRNNWAHQQEIPFDMAYRDAGNATRLLTALNIPKAADEARKIEQELLQLQINPPIQMKTISDITQEQPHSSARHHSETSIPRISHQEFLSPSKFGIKPLWAGWLESETVIGFSPRAYEKWKDSIQPGTRMLLYETTVQRPEASFKSAKGIIAEVEVAEGFARSRGLVAPTVEHNYPLRIKVLHGRRSVRPIPLEKVRLILGDPKFPYQGVAWYPLDEAVYNEFLKIWGVR
jgi:hypothetical protein